MHYRKAQGLRGAVATLGTHGRFDAPNLLGVVDLNAGHAADFRHQPAYLDDLALEMFHNVTDSLGGKAFGAAAGLLAQEYQRQTGFRMVVLIRSSQEAVDLLDQGKVHLAGVHWAEAGDQRGNAGALQDRGLSADLTLFHVADWEEGLAIRHDARIRNARQVAKSGLQWIGRAAGAGARRCQDQILGDRESPAKIAHDHRGVVEAIRSGWADVGACVRLASEEGRLAFIPISKESFDYCLPATLADDPRLRALQTVLRSASYRAMLLDLPGYDPRRCGDVQTLSANRS